MCQKILIKLHCISCVLQASSSELLLLFLFLLFSPIAQCVINLKITCPLWLVLICTLPYKGADIYLIYFVYYFTISCKYSSFEQHPPNYPVLSPSLPTNSLSLFLRLIFPHQRQIVLFRLRIVDQILSKCTLVQCMSMCWNVCGMFLGFACHILRVSISDSYPLYGHFHWCMSTFSVN